MKKVKFISFLLLLTMSTTTVIFNSCSKDDDDKEKYYDEGVIINGVRWATRNVAAPGTFAAKPEDAGMFYQWNRKKAWSATGDVTDWNASIPEGDSWVKSNDPSPAGWSVPTYEKIGTLFDKEKVTNEWTTKNGIKGIKFTDTATGESLFLPAAGARAESNGVLYGAGSLDRWYGSYWSSTKNESIDAYLLSFNSDDVFRYNSYRSYGLSIRSIAE